MKELPRFTMRLNLPKEEIAFAINKHFNDYEGDLNAYMNACVDKFDWEKEIKNQVELTIRQSIQQVFGDMHLGHTMKGHLRDMLSDKLQEVFKLEINQNEQ